MYENHPDSGTEADAIARIASGPVVAQRADYPTVSDVFFPPDWTHEVADNEHLEDVPRRASGTVNVYDADSFARAVRQRVDATLETGKAISLYSDEDAMALNAVLNDDREGLIPGWRDYRIHLALRRRPEWARWKANDGKMLEQDEFAEFIEDALEEISNPAPALMLDLAQTFQAHTAAQFRQGRRLSNGQVQFTYDETIDASAGTNGEITIPEELDLAVRPFFGSERYSLKARFRYRLSTGKLLLGYKLDRPDDFERAAFNVIATAVAQELDVPAIAGQAPAPRG